MKEIVIFGTSGHAKVVYDILLKQNIYKPVAFVSSNESLSTFLDLPHVHQSQLTRTDFKAGVIAIGDNFVRSWLVNYIKNQKHLFNFISAIHPSAQIASDVVLGEGTVIMAQCAVNSGTRVGAHVILNTGCLVDHDCKLDDFSSVAPGCVLGGNVSIGEFSAISLGAQIIHGKSVGAHSVIGAGALVLNDIESNKVAYGSPCKVIRSREAGEKFL